jgi:hypothetical protein
VHNTFDACPLATHKPSGPSGSVILACQAAETKGEDMKTKRPNYPEAAIVTRLALNSVARLAQVKELVNLFALGDGVCNAHANQFAGVIGFKQQIAGQ